MTNVRANWCKKFGAWFDVCY